MKYYMR